MDAEHVLHDLGHRLGLGRLAFDDDGVCELVFDGELVVAVERCGDGDGAFRLVASVAELPVEGDAAREALMAELLEANLLAQGTGGAVLAVDPGLDEVVMHRRFREAATDSAGFESALEGFLDHVQNWREHIVERGGAKPAAPAA